MLFTHVTNGNKFGERTVGEKSLMHLNPVSRKLERNRFPSTESDAM
jgi:hypothetical protein